MTLNPPGAPACVRCNSPLATAARDPLVGAKETVRSEIDTAAALALPGVVPAGYGLGKEEPPAPTGPGPAELRRIRRRITIAGLVLVALVLAGGGTALWLTRPRYVDTSAVAGTIGQELSARIGTTVTVTCDGSPRKEPGATFSCTARDAAGTQRPVTVTLVDDTGRYRWQLAD